MSDFNLVTKRKRKVTAEIGAKCASISCRTTFNEVDEMKCCLRCGNR